MNCERIQEQIPEALAGQLDAAAREAFVDHLEGCAECRRQVAELNAVWRGLAALDTAAEIAPDGAAKLRFREMLKAYQAGMSAGLSAETSARRPAAKARVLAFRMPAVWRAALAAGLLIGGVLIGRYAWQPAPEGNTEMAQLRGQIEGLRQTVALSMLQQQSPSARMRGVSYSEQIPQPDGEVLAALLDTVQHDSNVNVRLSAVDALEKFGGRAAAIRAMTDAIAPQESPLVQIALIDALAQLDARASAPDLEVLARTAGVNEMVRQRAAWAARKLEGAR
jgi:hypothetical protein